MGDHAVAYRFKVTGPRRRSVIEMLPYLKEGWDDGKYHLDRLFPESVSNSNNCRKKWLRPEVGKE